MDNLTHGLAGALLAEAVLELRAARGPAPTWRAAAYVTSILAHNLPDFDFLLVPLTGGTLGYLLHHRGHTHTFAFSLAAAALLTGGAWRFARRRYGARWREAWRDLAVLALLGLGLHIVLDFTNSYGVHPLWPLDNRWFYGDAVFIIEPWLWVGILPPMLFAARRWPAKVLFGLWLAGALIAAWWHPLVRPAIAFLLTLAALAGIAAQARTQSTRRWLAGAFIWVLSTAIFAVAGARADALVRAALRVQRPSATVHDVVTTPRPGDPFCHGFLAVSTEGDRYLVDRGAVSALPSWPGARGCVPADEDPPRRHTAPMVPSPLPANATTTFTATLEAPLEELRALASHCHAAAFLRFARVPFWVMKDEALILGDVRYDRGEGLDFAELILPPQDTECPRNVPPWVPPRSDLLRD